MACCGAYECPTCGGLVIVGEAGIKAYGEHVCTPKRIAEKRYLSDARVSLDDEVPGLPGQTYADVLA